MTATRAERGQRGRRDPDGRMPLAQHLLELRKRLTISAIAIAVAAVAGAFAGNFVFDAIRQPIDQIAEHSDRAAAINWATVTQNFDIRFQIAVTVAIVLASPVWLYQIWAFVVPGLVRKEKLYVISFFASAIPLFFAGCAAGWFVLPHIVELMLGFVSGPDASFLDGRYYYDFVLKLLLATGVAFVMPVFLVLFNFVGVLSAKGILKGWRIAILVITLFTAMATPAADVISMFLLAIPMVALYFAAAGIAYLHDRRVAQRAESLEDDLADPTAPAVD